MFQSNALLIAFYNSLVLDVLVNLINEGDYSSSIEFDYDITSIDFNAVIYIIGLLFQFYFNY